jgi:hypothetical protein
MRVNTPALLSAGGSLWLACAPVIAVELKSPEQVKNALSILAYVQDDMARKLPGKAYGRLPHENQEFQEAAVPMREAALNEPAAFRAKVDALLTRARAAARNLAKISETNDDAKIRSAVQAVADALKPLDELFPAGLRPVPGHLVGPARGAAGPPPDLK